ncbi:MAG: aminotransferase class V-fold PLP-dependent enzyme, partial [Pseudomonadota bacterium]
MSKLIENQRHLFDLPDDVAYFNVAALGPLPIAAAEAGCDGLNRKRQPWTISNADFFADTERVRPKLAQLINAEADGIAFCASVSYALATAANNLPVKPGQTILVLADQFPSNVYTWRALAERVGANVKTVGHAEAPEALNDALLSAITPETAIVACAQVRWTDGARIDL